nr:MAG TPA: Per os infectivity factor 6 [Caudoviricetes sp.]
MESNSSTLSSHYFFVFDYKLPIYYSNSRYKILSDKRREYGN